jgi:hypothetical protein
MSITFSDGMTFKTDGELHVEWRSDGYYVVGGGMLFAVETREEGKKAIEQIKQKRNGGEK